MTLPMIRRWAAGTPAAVALRCGPASLSYGAFWTAIEQTAQTLLKAGCEPGTVGAVTGGSRIGGWILALALQKAGLHSLTIGAPEGLDELHFGGLSHLIFGQEAHPGAPLEISVVRLDRPGAHRRLDAPGPGHILLTSATTGRPKALLLPPAVQRIRADGVREMHAMSPATVLHMGMFGYWALAGWSMTQGTWSAGGTVVLEPAGEGPPAMDDPDLTDVTLTPAMLAAVLRGTPTPLPPGANLRIVGGAISWATAEQAKARLAPRLFSQLGSTETGTFAMTRLETPEDVVWQHVHPTRTVQVVDGDGVPCATGGTGQVRVRRRPGDTDAYLEEPEATREHFQGDWFYPGDLGIIDAAGRLSLQGRTVDVVNIGGDKLAPAPYERLAETRLGVGAACLLEHPASDTVHLFVESRARVPQAKLRALGAALALPVPVTIHVLPEFPRTPAGKLDRRALQMRLAGGGSGV